MPNSVKGSKQYEMRVVPHRPWLRLLQGSVLTVTVASMVAASWFLGRHSGNVPERSPEDLQRLLSEQTRLVDENAELKRQLIALENSSVPIVQAKSETGDTGLSITRLEIDSTGELSRYRYRLVLRQRDADSDTWLIGHVKMELAGRVGEQPASIPLGDQAAGLQNQDILLRFRYFQNVEGEFTLPDGFIPEAVRVEAISNAPVTKTVAQEFDWIATRG